LSSAIVVSKIGKVNFAFLISLITLIWFFQLRNALVIGFERLTKYLLFKINKSLVNPCTLLG